MAKERQDNPAENEPLKEARLKGLHDAARGNGEKGPPPVHLWNPPYCGEIDLRIAADGSWHYLGSPIGRPALVRLFASILKREAEGYVLVTPVEKVGIRVEDAPFLAVEMSLLPSPAGCLLQFRTNVDDIVICDADHPLRFETEAGSDGLKPYLHVRRDLWARLSRPLVYDLVARGEAREIAGKRVFGIASGSHFFTIAAADSLKSEM
jgi:hypothetical protein